MRLTKPGSQTSAFISLLVGLCASARCAPAVSLHPPRVHFDPAPPLPSAISTGSDAPDYPGATWAPAAPDDYQPADRPQTDPIDLVVIHDIEGSAQGAVLWFQNPASHVSAHYVVSSTDGKVYQLVKERDIAWHAGNSSINHRSIGIEHEGFAYRPGFYNPQEYEASARLVRSITTRHNIPRDRAHIIGHSEVPDPRRPGKFGGANGHTDPGPYWDWASFMALVRNDSVQGESAFPSIIHPGEMVPAEVSFTNSGDDPWPADLKDAENNPVAGEGVVYLGLWGETGSPFFNYKSWTGPRLAARAASETPPQGAGLFRFSLLGPRSFGPVTERLRLNRVPVAPYASVAFGDVVSFTTDVIPWDIVRTAQDPGFSAPGWRSSGKLFWRKTMPADMSPAEWTAPLPISGAWDIYVRSTPGTTHSRKDFYQVLSADPLHAVPVDQRHTVGWRKIGRYHFADRQSAVVRLWAHGAPGAAIADAIRLVGPFPNH